MDMHIKELLEKQVKNNMEFQHLFEAIHNKICSFICFQSDNEPIVLTNWVVSTWFFREFLFTPYIHIYSPEPQCGKSTLMKILKFMTYKPKMMQNPSSALYRWIEQDAGTLFIDEIDKLQMDARAELIGMLNVGFEQDGAKVIRMEGTKHTPTEFEVFCPKVFAGIEARKLEEATRTRSIPVALDRKDGTVELRRAFTGRGFKEEFLNEIELPLEHLASEVTDDYNPFWSEDDYYTMLNILASVNPDDRAVDIGSPLLTIASMGSLEWTIKTINAINTLTLSREKNENYKDEFWKLVNEIYEQTTEENIFSKDLAEKINDNLDSQFTQWNRGNGINAKDIAKILSDYYIDSKNVRIGHQVLKGYCWNDLIPVMQKYSTEKIDIKSTLVELPLQQEVFYE
jgi:hypothetical protein